MRRSMLMDATFHCRVLGVVTICAILPIESFAANAARSSWSYSLERIAILLRGGLTVSDAVPLSQLVLLLVTAGLMIRTAQVL